MFVFKEGLGPGIRSRKRVWVRMMTGTGGHGLYTHGRVHTASRYQCPLPGPDTRPQDLFKAQPFFSAPAAFENGAQKKEFCLGNSMFDQSGY